MRHKQQRKSLRLPDGGFTIVELLVAMVVSLLALGAIYSTFLAQHRSYQVQEETSDMQQNIRTAMYYMQREIRMAGSDPYNVGGLGITAAGQNSITFTEDITGPLVGTPPNQLQKPDGFINDLNENITYALNGNDLQRTDNNGNGGLGDTQIVAENIDALDFVYLDSNGSVTANLNDIRSVQITIVARTNDQLLYGTTNNIIYRNQQGTAIFGPAGDNRSRRRLTTLIHCRNIGI